MKRTVVYWPLPIGYWLLTVGYRLLPIGSPGPKGTQGRRASIVRAGLACLALLVPALMAGCVTKSRAQAQAHAAYLAGQQEAVTRLQQAQVQGPSVRINGPVRNPVVPWTEGLTLLKAIMAAEYLPPTDPAQIVLVRGGLGRRLDVAGLLNGVDVPLQPGDVVQIILAGQAPAMPGQSR